MLKFLQPSREVQVSFRHRQYTARPMREAPLAVQQQANLQSWEGDPEVVFIPEVESCPEL